MITFRFTIRPLPEEEELDDELFAGTSEEGEPGNENKLVYDALLLSILKLTFRELVPVIIPVHSCR